MPEAESIRAYPTSARRVIALWMLAIAALLPLPFVMLDAYGEEDAAWDAVVAILWNLNGHLPVHAGVFIQERFRSCPLYVFLIKTLLSGGMLSVESIPYLINSVNIVVGLLLPACVFVLVRRLLGYRTALIATALLLSSPLVFAFRCYGFPAMPALLSVTVALIAFHSAAAGGGARRYVWLGLAALLASLAALTKSDSVLMAPCFLAVAIATARDGQRGRWVIAALVIPAVAVGAWHLFCTSVAPGAPETLESLHKWSNKWTLEPSGLLSMRNLQNLAMAPGIATTIAFVLATGIALAVPSLRWTGLLLLVCLVPTLLFWGMREINTSRHNLWIVLPVCTLVAAVSDKNRVRWGTAIAVAVLWIGNYMLGPTVVDPLVAPAHWLETAAQRRQSFASQQQLYVRALTDYRNTPKLCFLGGGSNAWIVVAALRGAKTAKLAVTRLGWDWRLDLGFGDRRQKIWLTPPFVDKIVLETALAEGWIVWAPPSK